MKNVKLMLCLALFAFTAIQLTSCDDDDEQDPNFSFSGVTINDDDYSMGGTPRVLFSTDGGSSWSETLPEVGNGTVVMAKVNNGTADLTDEDFTFDWSGSSPAPSNVNSDIAEFTVGSDIAVNVTVSDKWSLVTTQRANGKVYTVNTATGATTESFTPMFDAVALPSLRGFVYHPTQRKFYVSQTADAGGSLYTIDAATKTVTRINENLGSEDNVVWDAIVNWAVASDDSLIAVGDFNDDGNGIVKFGTDGGRSLKTAQADICCALGMLYDPDEEVITVANGENNGDQEVIIENYSTSGELIGTATEITTFNGFTDDISTHWLNLRSMAKDKDGTIYGTLHDDDSKKTYLVKVDLTAKTITYVSTLGADNNNQYNALAFVPNYAL